MNATAKPVGVGFVMYGHDNDGYFFDEDALPEGILCPNCRSLVDQTYFPNRIDVGSILDISTTYDGRTIASKKFKDFCTERAIPGIDFAPVKGRKGKEYYVCTSDRVLEYDFKRRRTRLLNRCPVCGNFEEIIGATPAYLRFPDDLQRGFYRTDLEFGSGAAKHPLLLVDPEFGAQLEASGMTGLDLHEIVR